MLTTILFAYAAFVTVIAAYQWVVIERIKADKIALESEVERKSKQLAKAVTNFSRNLKDIE